MSKDEVMHIKGRILPLLKIFVLKDVKTFITGGAIGFDMLIATMIVQLKLQRFPIKWVLALPCRNHNAKWTQAQKIEFEKLKKYANEIIYVSESYHVDCMRERNMYMVDNSDWCVCAYLTRSSGTGQTMNYARKLNKQIIEICLTKECFR